MKPEINNTQFVRIKLGSGIFQDHCWGSWPNCLPSVTESLSQEQFKYTTRSPNRVFIGNFVDKGGKYWDCKARGYGFSITTNNVNGVIINEKDFGSGQYGNGSMSVYGKDSVEIVTYQDYLESEEELDNFLKGETKTNEVICNELLDITPVTVLPEKDKPFECTHVLQCDINTENGNWMQVTKAFKFVGYLNSLGVPDIKVEEVKMFATKS